MGDNETTCASDSAVELKDRLLEYDKSWYFDEGFIIGDYIIKVFLILLFFGHLSAMG